MLAFRAANLLHDANVLEEARREVEALLVGDPGLEAPESASLRVLLEHPRREKLGLARVG